MTRLEFAECIGVLESAFGKRFSTDDLKVWFDLLRDLPLQSLQVACRRLAMESERWPTVAAIRRLAIEHREGVQPTHGNAWEPLLRLVRRFGFYQREQARQQIPRLVWRALGGNVGWEWLCEMTADQRPAYAAQFRQRYEQMRADEQRMRALPEPLRPRIRDDSPPEPPALIADDRPTERVPIENPFRDAAPAPVVFPDAAEIERRRDNQRKAATAIIDRRQSNGG